MEAKGLAPVFGPEIEPSKFFDYLLGEVFLRGRSILLNDCFRVFFEVGLDLTECADFKRVTGCLTDFVASGIPVVDNIELVAFWVTEEVVQIIYYDNIQIKEEDALSTEVTQRVVAEGGLFAVIVTCMVDRFVLGWFWVANNCGMQVRKCFVGK